ncbi:sulfatase [Paraphaeosphaeria sporulosa]
MLSSVLNFILALAAGIPHANRSGQTKPKIIFILSDNEDRRLESEGSDCQTVLQREIVAKVVESTKHYGTTAQCCPARTSILQGRLSHNTNITHVKGAGIMDITYINYTLDKGYHIGQNRAPARKALLYVEDPSLHFAVRGPSIPEGMKSSLPITHVVLFLGFSTLLA